MFIKAFPMRFVVKWSTSHAFLADAEHSCIDGDNVGLVSMCLMIH